MFLFQVLKVKFNQNIKSHHCLYYKPHKLNSQKSDDQPNDDELASRTLFVYNVPPYADKSAMRNVFSCYGSVQHVLLFTKPTRNPFATLTSTTTKTEDEETSPFFKHIIVEDDDEFSIEAERPLDDGQICFKVAYVIFAEAEAIDRAVNKPVQDKVRVFQDTKKQQQNGSANQTTKVGLQSKIS